MAKNKIIKTTILAGIFSTAFAENNNKPNLYRNFDWEDLLNKFEEYKSKNNGIFPLTLLKIFLFLKQCLVEKY